MSSGPAAPSFWRKHRVKLLASLVIAAALAWVLNAGALPLVPEKGALAQVRWWTVTGYVALWCLVHVVRAARWAHLLAPIHPVPMRRVITSAFVGFAAILLLPLRMGEVVRPVMIRKKGELSGWAATGTVAAERIIDGLFLTVMLFVALQLAAPLDPLPRRIGELAVPVNVVPRAAYTMLFVFASAFVTMAMFYWRRELARKVTRRVVGLVSATAADWLADRIERVACGFSFLPRLEHSAPFVALTTVYWLLNCAAAWLVAWGCGFDIGYAQACALVGVIALGILVPNAPGFFGAFQIAIYAALAMFFPANQVVFEGSALAFVLYVSQVGITVLAAAGSMLIEHVSVSDALGATSEDLDAAGGPAT